VRLRPALHILLSNLFGALLPLDVHNLGELEIGRVGGEQTGGRAVGAGQANLRVDVEHTGRTAWRPDDGGGVSFIMLQIIAVHRTNKVVLCGRLCCDQHFSYVGEMRFIPEQSDQRSSKWT
jgi:hypothetical protein